MMKDDTAGASPVEQSVGRHVRGLISAEMSQYSDGAYADHGSARDQLERFAAEVQAPLLARIRELTLYAASVEAERESAREEARQNFVRAREWAERCGAAESQRDEALEDAVRAYDKLVGVHASAKEHKDRAKQLAAELETALDVTGLHPLSEETIARLMPEPTVCKANVVRWDRAAMRAFARAIENEHGISL